MSKTCPTCGVVVNDLPRHLRRKRCKAQHYHYGREMRKLLKARNEAKVRTEEVE